MALPVSSCYGVIGIIMLWSNRYPYAMVLRVSSCYRVIGILMLSSNRYPHAME